jgi:hypothetical protein
MTKAKATAEPKAPPVKGTDKKKITMRSVGLSPDGKTSVNYEALDYVPEAYVEAYVADALIRWQYVEVSEGYDSGPGGDKGQTHIPPHLQA